MESFDYDFGLLVDSFIEYANKNCFFPSKDEVMRLILDFVDKYDDRVLYNNIDDLAIDDNVFLYHWCKCSHFVHKRQLKATISPDGYGVAYNYDALGNLESIQPAQISGTGYTVNSTGEVEYEYDTANRLSKILTDTTVYNFTYDNFGKTSQIKAGSNLLASYTYNTSNGKLNTLTYGNGAKVRYEYDELDRIEKILYNANGGSTYNVAYEYEYDSNGNIVCVTDNITGQTLQPQYDITGRVISSVTVEDGKVISGTHVEYDEKSRISLYKYSFENPTTSYEICSQIVNTYLYNEDGTLWLSHATHGDYQSEISPDYDVFGRIKSKSNQVEIDYNDKFTVNQSYQYESSGRNLSYLVKKLTISINAVGSSTAKYNNSYDYEYNGNGYITGITETNSQNETKYYYDSKGQIIREDNGSINETIVWEYDSAGNIISKKRYDYTNNTTPTALRETVTYSYAANSDRLTSFGGQSITYDTIGNPLNYMGTTLEWEHGRELHKYGSYTYTYDANGIRINKSYTSNGTTYNTKYIVDGSRVMRQVWNSASGNYVCDYIYDENGMPMAFALSKNGGEYEYYFYETNIQGDIVGVYDSNGDVIVRYKYTAYGEITNTPVQSSLLTSDFNQAILFRYRGYIYDSESGFYYLQSRYYDPEVGRFINADLYISTGTGILNYNIYSYCANNPINFKDDSGELIELILLGALLLTSAVLMNSCDVPPKEELYRYNEFDTYEEAYKYGLQKVYGEAKNNDFQYEFGCVVVKDELNDKYLVSQVITDFQLGQVSLPFPNDKTPIATIHSHPWELSQPFSKDGKSSTDQFVVDNVGNAYLLEANKAIDEWSKIKWSN